MTENNEVKESVKNSVKERIKYIVQKISNESTKKVIKNLKEELKEKVEGALDETLKNVPEEIEKKLEGSIKKVTEELVKDNIEKEDVLSKIEPFEKSLTKYFSSLPKTVSPIVFTPLIKAAIITGTVITVAIIATALIIPPPTGGRIEGEVFTPDGEPIGGVHVYIEDGPSSRSVYTDDDGYYKLEDLIPGIYGIVADISDYGVQRIDDIVVERGEGVWMDFRTSTPTPTPSPTHIITPTPASATTSTPTPTPTPTTPAAFQITNANHPSSVISGGDRGDLEVWWGGNPTFPVTMIYRPKPGWGCPQGGCTVVKNTFHNHENPLVFKGAVWCYGYEESGFFNYEVLLRDAEGKETRAVSAGFNCIVK